MNEKEEKLYKKHQELEFNRSQEFTQKLRETFPILWRQPQGRNHFVSCNTGKGWEHIIWEMSQDIENQANSVRFLFPVEELPYIAELKEKFGSLRVAVYNSPEPIQRAVSDAVSRAENRSYSTCEHCGNHGKARSKWPDLPEVQFGWVKVFCESCWYKEAEFRAMRGYGANKDVRRWYHERMKAQKQARGKNE